MVDVAVKHSPPHILLVNPWIHDFAAYDVWSKPMGLLILGSVLRDHGYRVSYIDCLDRFHPKARPSDPNARHGRGPYIKTPLPLPEGLEDMPRRFSRYGIKPEWFVKDLESADKPDLILVTSVMTYWAPGVIETIAAIKDVWEDVPVWLGGIYATLCSDHARSHSGADRVVTGPAENDILKMVGEFTGGETESRYDTDDINALPYPAYDLQRVINYVPLRTSKGCPFRCSYCASGVLSPSWARRDPHRVVDEIKYWHDVHGVRDYAFYDDALLIDSKHHADIIFQEVIDSGMTLHFHTPNALHARAINVPVAELMYRAGFETLRLGVESTDFDKREHMDSKVTESDFERAVFALKSAGFSRGQIGAYLLTGLPGQSFPDIEYSVREVLKSGIMPVLTHFTPIPHTAMWEKSVRMSRYNLTENPVFTNNSIFPCSQETFSWDELSRLKKMIANWRTAE